MSRANDSIDRDCFLLSPLRPGIRLEPQRLGKMKPRKNARSGATGENTEYSKEVDNRNMRNMIG